MTLQWHQKNVMMSIPIYITMNIVYPPNGQLNGNCDNDDNNIIIMYIYITIHNQKKFRRQTSDNMGRWKSKGCKSQRRERQKKEDQRRERQKKEDSGAQKVEKSGNTLFFQCFVAPGGRKVASVKWQVRSHLWR